MKTTQLSKDFNFLTSKVDWKQKLGFSVGGSMGGNFIYSTISSFATLYYTDSVGISAAVVGTMMLIARFFDGVSDVAMGTVIDKTNTKMGKARPWFLISIIPLILSLLLVFNVPQSLGATGKIVYMYITYIFSAVIAYTMMIVANNTMLMLITGNLKERVQMNALANVFGFVAIIVINMFTATLAEAIGWSKVSLLYAAIAAVLLAMEGLLCRETYHLTNYEEKIAKQENTPISKALPNLLKNRYFYIIILLGILNYIGIGTTNGAGIYYCLNFYGNPSLFGLATIAGMAPCILVLPFVNKIVELMKSKKNALVVGYFLQLIGFGLVYFTVGMLPMMIIGLAIKGFGLGIIAALLIPLVGDVADYDEWKTGMRLDGITQSASSLGCKVGTGLGSAFLGWGLAMGGYEAAAAVQSESALHAINMIFSGIPALCAAVALVLTLFFTIEKYVEEVQAALKEKND
ncbi:MAG: MFS transporter [Lachnospiraceae bacterium]|nr:MFS transporter [Lachnospiraceae bacterium]